MTQRSTKIAKARAPLVGVSRRNFVAGLTAGGVALTAGGAARAACSLTATQIDGPFYPVSVDADYDTDMTRIAGGSGRAEGEVVEVVGQVRDAACNPVANCVLEVWQANRHGRYTHPGDKANERPLDPNFQSYARITADGEGRYRFMTIKPGAYPALGAWVRPPHIHFKAHAAFHPGVTTQMYFAGEQLNDNDLLLQSLNPAQQQALVVGFDGNRADNVPSGRFDLVLDAGWMPPPELMEQLQQG
jgi:protocatechuate 3,4-dioxygenase beta subunit